MTFFLFFTDKLLKKTVTWKYPGPPRVNLNNFIEKFSVMLETSILNYRDYKFHILGD